MGKIDEFLDRHTADLVRELTDWVHIPSVAGIPDREPDLLRSANWLAGTLRATGFPSVEVWNADGAPAVFAQWCAAPGAPTVLIYSHHDVRATKDEQWEQTTPFDAVVRDGYVYGRGASDAKGQVLAHLWGIRAHLAATGSETPAVNLKLLVEGEEETGSAQLAGILDDHRDRLGADLIVFSDSQNWRIEHPAVCTSLRGIVSAELSILGPLRDVHSGGVSGPAPNPAIELARVITELHDEQGRITLPGFYDDVSGPTEARRRELAALPYTDEDWLARSETRSIGGEAGFTVLERLWTRPAAEVLTMVAGDPGGPAQGAIPAVATAALSIRLAPGQQATKVADQLRRWIKSKVQDRFAYDLSVAEETSDPYETPAGLPALAALSDAMHDAFGTRQGRMGNSGSGPAELLARKLDAPVLFFGTGLTEDRWHDSDERTAITMLHRGAATLAGLWPRLAAH
jgi:acetylornithine deacetylase/succinyl-diaminopimelate desuccinylase-like protein